MSRIHRIVYREIAPPGLIALLVLTFVVFTREFGQAARLIVQHRAEAETVMEMILALLPQILVYTIPISFLVGTLVGFSRLSTDSEIVALRAGGVSVYQMILPAMKVGIGVTLVTALFTCILFPMGNWRFYVLQRDLGAGPLQSEIKAHIFYEDIPDKILYVEDQVLQTSEWKGVFMADYNAEKQRRLVLAKDGRLVVSPDNSSAQLDFEGALMYEIDPTQPSKYKWSVIESLQVPVASSEDAAVGDRPRKPREMPMQELWRDIQQGTPQAYRYALVEFNRRIALPISALLYAILGVTLGARPHRGGRGYGMVVSITLAFSYYALLESGVELSEGQVVPVAVGIWGPNILLFLAGLLSLRLANFETARWPLPHVGFAARVYRSARQRAGALSAAIWRGVTRAWNRLWRPPEVRVRLARVVDLYVVRIFVVQFLMTLSACIALFYLFTFFEIVNDIFANRVDYWLTAEYFLYLLPHVLSLLVPISTLIATLITFGLLEKTSQLVALKSCGISIYQVAMPIFALALIISAAGFLNQEYLLPYANQRQDNLRAVIKGRPVQTHYTPERNWIFGKDNRLYNYNHYDPERDAFAELSIYALDIRDSRLLSHTYARQAHWDRQSQSWKLVNGWVRHFEEFGNSVSESEFEAFEETWLRLPEFPDYFEEGVRQSSKMTYPELDRYIRSLQQGGFEVDHLRTELYSKVSLPIVPLIMTLLGIPFAFTIGRKGTLYGVAAGVIIGIVYWGAFGVFGELGAGGLLAPLLAAWGPNIVFGAGGAFLFLTIRT